MILTGLLTVIFLQDFRERSISWYLIPLVFFSAVSVSVLEAGILISLKNLVINLMILSIEIFLLYAWIRLRTKTRVNIRNGFLGIGDVLFFVALTPLFSASTYVLFITGASFLVLITFGIYVLVKRNSGYKIPLAGGIAVLLIPVLLFRVFLFALPFTDNTIMFRLLELIYV